MTFTNLHESVFLPSGIFVPRPVVSHPQLLSMIRSLLKNGALQMPQTLSRTWLGQFCRQNRILKKNTRPHGRTSSSKFEALSKNFEVMLYDVTVLILVSGSNQASPKTETGQILSLPDRSAALTWRCTGDCFAAKEQEHGCFLFQIPWKMVCLAYF